MRMYDIIAKKRDGEELSREELKFFIDGFCSGDIPDYQASALLMAIYLNKMTPDETLWLTELMVESGDRIDLSAIDGVKVDKHSTGGVGDKTSLVVVPLAIACGLKVPKMSGRGLGHTGGTLDKLESIPGFRTDLTIDEIIEFTNRTGGCIAGQTGNLVPADKKLYALRDVTATIENVSLIASSIMSKKIASGADVIVLDVKFGSGAFMKTVEKARELAFEMVRIGRGMGRKTTAVITNMDRPLGNNIGNSLEVIEAIEVLKGGGPDDFTELCREAVKHMIMASGMERDESLIQEKIEKTITEGKALNVFREIITNQGGNPGVIDDYSLFGKALIITEVRAAESGYIESIKTDDIGIASMVLGGGREKKEDKIDYNAGLILRKKTGDSVQKGDIIAEIHTNRQDKVEEADRIINGAYKISKVKPGYAPIIYEII